MENMNTSVVVNQAMVAVRDINFVSEEDKKAAVKVAVNEQVRALVQSSFSGSLATSQLFEHFSTIGSIDDCLEHYVVWCYSSAGWLKKSEVGTGKSEKLSGWKALRRYAAKLLLIESNQTYTDEMSDPAITAAVRAIWSGSQNDRAKTLFVNATVYNNLASYKSSYLTKKAAEKDVKLPETVIPQETLTAETVQEEIREESKATMRDHLAAMQREIASVKADPKATKQDLVELVEYVSEMIEILLS